MKKILNNQWVIVIGGGLLVLLMWKYLLPILPEGATAWKYVLTGVRILLTYGVVILSIYLHYRYYEFNKKFVIQIMFFGVILSAYIMLDIAFYITENVTRWITEATGVIPIDR